MNSVKKWLIANKKDDKDIENLEEIAASRVKYTLPGTVYIRTVSSWLVFSFGTFPFGVMV